MDSVYRVCELKIKFNSFKFVRFLSKLLSVVFFFGW